MIAFEQENDGPDLMLIYTSENNEGEWLKYQLQTTGKVSLSGRIFDVTKERLIELDEEDDEYEEGRFVFYIGTVCASYYCIDREVLGLNFDLAIHVSIKLERRVFAAERNISIFRRMNEFDLKTLWVGGDKPGALPKDVFEKLLRDFPNTYELNRYAAARVSAILREHLPIEQDHEDRYKRYMNRRVSRALGDPREDFAAYEVDKYSDLISRIEVMLEQPDSYNEGQWQKEILGFILFLFPKYVTAFREAPVRDSLAGKDRAIDFLLVDASGYVDGIEIKKPFSECIVTRNRYRDNHVPMRELNGTVMQLEKYLFHLNRWGQVGEQRLNKRYAPDLPAGVEIKIVNPTGMIIMGRDTDWTPEQRIDFEVIRRKYRHVLEIMTYDDLLRRLKVIRDQFEALAQAQ
ncbi:Shedu immune nuclease family protein [Luteolibacter marinus]|uniref:Shedu immune nuclease family protein n=1 Tax=Luteolibacter marinus TaxID=2776705 RepID=UPI001869506A|nr:Shedu immune nuclease family protein [Luteolibacter marinus]